MKAEILLAIAALAVSAGADTTYYLKAASTGSNTTAFKDASFWVDSNGTASGASGDALDPNADYVMNYSLRQTRGATYAHFGGKSLRIGGDGTSTPYLACYYNEGTSFDKLYLTSGYFIGNRGHDMTYNIAGDIEVDAPDASPFLLTLSYTNSAFSFTGSLSAGAQNRVKLATMSPCYSVSKQTGYGYAADDSWHCFNFDTDMSGFLGTLELGRTTGGYFVATPTLWQIKARFPSSRSVPGTILVPNYDALAVAPSAALTVGTLSLAAGSMLEYETDGNSFGSVAVTDSLSVTGPVTLSLKGGDMPAVGEGVTLFSVPDVPGNAFTEADFTVVQTCIGSKITISVVTDGTTRRLVASWPRWRPESVVTLETGDTSSKEYKASVAGSFDSSLTNAAHWSNREIPQSGYHYYVNGGKSLRTRSDISDDTFAGDSLTIGSKSMLLVMTTRFTVPDLRMVDGSILAAPNVGSFTLKGNLWVPCGSVRLRQYVRRAIHFAGKVTGEAELVLEGWNSTSSPNGYYDFDNADMTDFKGTIRVTEHSGMARPDYDKTNQTLTVGSAAGEIQLGGKLDAFNPRALTLERYASLALTSGNTLNITTNNNRGIYVNGNGRITVQSDWHTLNVTTRLTVNGTLTKNGAGKLVLGGECVAEGANPALHIASNSVVVASAGSVDGLTVRFDEGTSLRLKLNLADEELTRYGIRNTATDTPFELPAGMTELPLVIDASGATRPNGGLELGIVTVSSSAAQAVEGMLPAFASPFPRMGSEMVRKTDAVTGDVTFAIRLYPFGTQFILR